MLRSLAPVTLALVLIIASASTASASTVSGADETDTGFATASALLGAASFGLDIWTLAELDDAPMGTRIATGFVGAASVVVGAVTILEADNIEFRPDATALYACGAAAIVTGTLGAVLAFVADTHEAVPLGEDVALTPFVEPALDTDGDVAGWRAGAQLRVVDW